MPLIPLFLLAPPAPPPGQVTALSVMALPGPVHVFVAKGGIDYVTAGIPFLFTAANHESTEVFFLEVFIKATSGTAEARLFDVTAATLVTGSGVNTTATILTRLRSGAITMTDGNEYEAQYGSDSSSGGEGLGAKIIGIN